MPGTGAVQASSSCRVAVHVVPVAVVVGVAGSHTSPTPAAAAVVCGGVLLVHGVVAGASGGGRSSGRMGMVVTSPALVKLSGVAEAGQG